MARYRLHALSPYFAMFPEEFAAQKIDAYSRPGDLVVDPFSGRGTTLLQALLMRRRAVAIDINPVAYCISGAKAQLPELPEVTNELAALEERFEPQEGGEISAATAGSEEFFKAAFHADTLDRLVFLRHALNWRHDNVHRFVAALVLGILHGEMGRSIRYLSNQLPRTISPKPEYSIRWWNQRGLVAPNRDVFSCLKREAALRLRQEPPSLRGEVVLGDARNAAVLFPHHVGGVRLALTSPPYLDVTNFEEDQWLRRWFLGGPPRVTYREISKDDRHENEREYWAFLRASIAGLAPLLAPDAVMVFRLGALRLTEQELIAGFLETVGSVLPQASSIEEPTITTIRRRQTDAFRPGSKGCRFEVDFVLAKDGTHGAATSQHSLAATSRVVA